MTTTRTLTTSNWTTSKKLPKESTRTTALLKFIKKTWGEQSFFVKIHGSPFQPRVVDIIGCFFGIYVALEVKRPDNSVTPRQEKTLRDIDKAGGFRAVVWSISDTKTFLESILDKASVMAYISHTNADADAPTRKERGVHNMPSAKSKSAKAGKAASKTSKRSAKVEEPEDDIEDLEDLDDLDDFVEDDEDEEDEDEEDVEDEDDEEDEDDGDEDEEPESVKTRSSRRAANDKTAAKAKASKKPSAVKTTKVSKTEKTTAKPAKTATAKKSGTKPTPPTRALGEGFVGVKEMADELGVDQRALRLYFRKNDVAKNSDGRYAWKEGGRDYARELKKAQAHFKD